MRNNTEGRGDTGGADGTDQVEVVRLLGPQFQLVGHASLVQVRLQLLLLGVHLLREQVAGLDHLAHLHHSWGNKVARGGNTQGFAKAAK